MVQTTFRRGAAALAAVAFALALGACAGPAPDPTKSMSVDKLYEEARDDMSSGAYPDAAKKWERLEGRAAGTVLAQQAQLERAYALYKSGEKADALSVVDRFIKLHPTSAGIDYAYYLKGLINFNDDLGLFGKWVHTDLSERDQQASRDSYQAFKQLVDQFPDSQYAPDARLRISYIINSLASYEVHVARYYYTRAAYVAAINRAQYAIEQYRTAPAVEEALYILVSSYDKLGMEQLRDDARRVLEKNFPASQLLARGYQVADKPWWKFW